ncbi:MAG TPA: hypothetical protein VGM92_00635 [Candidatus Kapabacteria bacterium]|jgi:hypothetical protein
MHRYPSIPDVRDGLTEVERTILLVMHEARKEYGERSIPTVLIYGRVVELLDLSWEEFQKSLGRFSGQAFEKSAEPYLDLFSDSGPETS